MMHYDDLADAVEDYKQEGYEQTFEIKNNHIYCKNVDREYDVDEVKIIKSYRHERMTDPGTDSTVFALEASDGTKGLLVAGYGMYVDQDKAEIIDALMKNQEETE